MDSDEITVGFTAVANSHLKLLPREEQQKVVEYTKRIRAGNLGDASPLRHVNGLIWRKKLGDIRILFTHDTRTKEVVIRLIAWRREDTYDDLKSLVQDVEVEKKFRLDVRKKKAKKAKSDERKKRR
jgi:mRNA-degrading endonuclease RelE of RelBE toxin-antitoxin system